MTKSDISLLFAMALFDFPYVSASSLQVCSSIEVSSIKYLCGHISPRTIHPPPRSYSTTCIQIEAVMLSHHISVLLGLVAVFLVNLAVRPEVAMVRHRKACRRELVRVSRILLAHVQFVAPVASRA